MSRKRQTLADEPYLLIRSSATNPRGGEVIKEHAHDWHQLIYVTQGAISVWTEAGSWVAPPSWGIWVPAGVRHGIRFIGECAFRTLYVRPGLQSDLSDQCCVLTVSSLLRELILRTTTIGMLDERDATERAIVTVTLAELRQADIPPFTLPQPATEPTRRAANLILKQAHPALTTAELARAVSVSARTLERRFVMETGLSFGRWRQHQDLLRALEQLAVGAPIKVIAASTGYASPSAFIAAFRKFFGTTPGRYFGVRSRSS